MARHDERRGRLRRSAGVSPSLLELTLFVSDVDKSAEFFRALGLKLFDVDDPGHPHMVDGGIGRSAAFQLF